MEQKIRRANGEAIGFEVDAFRKHCLVNGLDDIGLTLQKSNAIEIYEDKRVKQAPWTFAAA